MQPSARNLTLLALAALCTLPAVADDTETHGEAPDKEAAMAAMQEAAAPGEHHKFLARLVGDWSFASKVWMAPGAPPEESAGRSSKKMIMGGRYLQEEVEGSMMGNAFTGRGVTAYDNAAGEFINTWIDSMATGVAIARGQRDGDRLELHGEYLDPMSQQPMKVRYVTRVVDDDTHVFQYFMTMPGAPEQKSMEIEYTRSGK